MRNVLSTVALLACSTAVVLGRVAPRSNDAADSSWPYLPWSTRERDVINSRGEAVTIVGANWPGAGETMLPEGLQYASAKSTIDRLADVGFNFVRHTYAIEMIDQIYERDGGDVSLYDAFVAALGTQNGTQIVDDVVKANSEWSWSRNTTRMQVWRDIAAYEHERGIVMHLDNHVSKAKWCCSHTDGNAWFADAYFDLDKWHRGLAWMARWAKEQKNVPSMSLRNELRSSANDTSLQYNWLTWAGNMTAGADVIHAANQDLLITFSGLQYDQDLSVVTAETDLYTSPAYQIDVVRDGKRREPKYFRIDDHPWSNKAVLELHLYSMSANVDTDSCAATHAELYRSGFNGLGIDPPALCSSKPTRGREQYECHPAKRRVPVWLTEFGQAQDATLYNGTLINCLRRYTQRHNIGWAVWGLAGSYYTREGTQDLDDSWALLNHQWSDWRDPSTFDGFWRKWIKSMGRTNLELD